MFWRSWREIVNLFKTWNLDTALSPMFWIFCGQDIQNKDFTNFNFFESALCSSLRRGDFLHVSVVTGRHKSGTLRGSAARSQPQSRRQANGTVLHVFAISSLLFGDWMYNAASVLMRHVGVPGTRRFCVCRGDRAKRPFRYGACLTDSAQFIFSSPSGYALHRNGANKERHSWRTRKRKKAGRLTWPCRKSKSSLAKAPSCGWGARELWFPSP